MDNIDYEILLMLVFLFINKNNIFSNNSKPVIVKIVQIIKIILVSNNCDFRYFF
jgi:hypothetical protein